MEQAMRNLDKKGLFGQGEKRLGIVINAEYMPPDNLAMELVERCLDLSKEFFSYRSKGWEFMPDQV